MMSIRTGSIVAMFAAAALTPGVGAQVLLADHFDGGIGGEWTSIKGGQWWENGWLHNMHLGPVFVNGRDSIIAAHDGDMTWVNYTFSARLDLIRTQAWSGEYWVRGGVLFRTRNLEREDLGYGAHASYYRLDLVGPGDVEPPRLLLWRVLNGSEELLQDFQWVGAPAGPYDLYITAEDAHISISIDGVRYFDFVDPNAPGYGAWR